MSGFLDLFVKMSKVPNVKLMYYKCNQSKMVKKHETTMHMKDMIIKRPWYAQKVNKASNKVTSRTEQVLKRKLTKAICIYAPTNFDRFNPWGG